jgi:hypothetical protein
MLDSHDLSHQVWLRKDFVPGRYADAKSGTGFATHADAGMVLEFEIAE